MRLTKNRKVRFLGFSQREAGVQFIADIYEKLMLLENAEEELGIDALVFVKAITGCFYVNVKFPKGILYPTKVCGSDCQLNKSKEGVFFLSFPKYPYVVNFGDYGKKKVGGWALTKEELK